MPHYKDGTPAQIGDVVKWTDWNRQEQIGRVAAIHPGTGACNLTVAFTRCSEVTLKPSSTGALWYPLGVIAVQPDGRALHFEPITATCTAKDAEKIG